MILLDAIFHIISVYFIDTLITDMLFYFSMY